MDIYLQFDWDKIGGGLWSLETAYWIKQARPDARIMTNFRPSYASFPVLPWMQQHLTIPTSNQEIFAPDYDLAIRNPIANGDMRLTASEDVTLPWPEFTSMPGREPPHVLDLWHDTLRRNFPGIKNKFDPAVLQVNDAQTQSLDARADWQAFRARHSEFVVINVNTSTNFLKDIQMRDLGQMAKKFADDGYGVILTGYSDDKSLHFAVKKLCLFHSKTMLNWVSSPEHLKLSVEELFVVLGRAKLVISGDTGPAKIAGRLGVPVVEIFRMTAPSACAARGSYVSVLRGSAVPRVMETATEMMRAGRSGNKAAELQLAS